VAAACAGILLLGDDAARALRYERNALLDGQLWRAVTGHFVHVSWLHLGFELLGATLAVVLFRPWLGWGAPLLCALGTSAGLFLFELRARSYCGLAGALHGIFVYGALVGWRRHRLAAWLVVIGVVLLKLLVDVGSGDVTLTGADEPAANLAGAVSGALAFVLLYRPSRTRL
jgi:rhomboid family GlyGly-CTERM serine protease